MLDLQELKQIGHLNTDVQLAGHVWTIHTLTVYELAQATNDTKDFDPESRIIILRASILAHAIDTIDNEFIGSLRERMEFFSELQSNIVNKLYDHYEQLVEQSYQVLLDEQVHNIIMYSEYGQNEKQILIKKGNDPI